MAVTGLATLIFSILLGMVAGEDAASLGSLRDKLANQKLDNISYFIVNEKDPLSRLLYPELLKRSPAGVPVYQQKLEEEDIWDILGGEKDDFLIYDRCGRLTFHIRLPYSYLHYPYVEAAIRSTYSRDHCGNCTFYLQNATIEDTENGTVYSPENGTMRTEVEQHLTTLPPKRVHEPDHGYEEGNKPFSAVKQSVGEQKTHHQHHHNHHNHHDHHPELKKEPLSHQEKEETPVAQSQEKEETPVAQSHQHHVHEHQGHQ